MESKVEVYERVFVYDVNSIPEGMDLEKVLDLYKRTGVLVYDSFSSSGNEKPLSPIVVQFHEENITWGKGSITVGFDPATNGKNYSTWKKAYVLVDQNGKRHIVSKEVLDWFELGDVLRQGSKTFYFQNGLRYEYIGEVNHEVR